MKSDQQKINLYLEDILGFCRKIERYIKDLTRELFEKEEVVVDAVLRNLELLGEASRKLPEDFKTKHSEIPWKKVIGLRNIVIHEYAEIDFDIIWEIITKNIPETKRSIEKIYNELSKDIKNKKQK